MAESKKIVKNASAGHGYHYANLADFARQGVEIPKMRIDATGDFVEAWDGEAWQRGAKIVMPGENRSMNAAQAYGAALTYARRYTVAMLGGIATDDDDAVETGAWTRPAPKAPAKITEKQITELEQFGATLEQIAGWSAAKAEAVLRAKRAIKRDLDRALDRAEDQSYHNGDDAAEDL